MYTTLLTIYSKVAQYNSFYHLSLISNVRFRTWYDATFQFMFKNYISACAESLQEHLRRFDSILSGRKGGSSAPPSLSNHPLGLGRFQYSKFL